MSMKSKSIFDDPSIHEQLKHYLGVFGVFPDGKGRGNLWDGDRI